MRGGVGGMKWNQRLWYSRLEIPKRDLQAAVFEKHGFHIEDPEVLVQYHLADIIPLWDCEIEFEVYEECDTDEIILVVEVYRTG